MKEEPLDQFDNQFKKNTKIVSVKVFYFESKARLYAARLKEVGIQSFISNANTTTVIPLGEGGIRLHVKEEDMDQALVIIRKLDAYSQREVEESFHDSDKEDIAYERDLRNPPKKKIHIIILVVLVIATLVILRAFLRASGMVESWRDYF